MKCWIFRDYISERGRNEIREWLDSLPPKAAVKLDLRFRHLEATKVFEPQYVSALTGHDDIFEIRVVRGGVQYRPLGCYGPEKGEFTILVGAVEKGDKLEPKTAVETAERRRAEVMKNRRQSREHDYRA